MEGDTNKVSEARKEARKETKKETTALYAGTFDPFTIGHLDIVHRALRIFDHVVVLVAVSPHKAPLFSKEARLQMLNELFIDDQNVSVGFWSGLVVDYARDHNIGAVVRGLRPTGDFEIEFQMASMNRKLYPECDTIFLMTGEKHYYISSTLVREVFTHGGDISRFVPALIEEKLKLLKDELAKK